MSATSDRLSGAETPLAFMECLRDYRALRGKPGSRLMAERCKQAYTATPIASALAADTLPKPEMLRAILDGLHSGPADRAAFEEARERLVSAAVAAELTPPLR